MTNETPAKKKAAPGWYPHPKKDGFERLWDGETWMEDIRLINTWSGTTPGGLIGLGAFLAVLTGALSAAFLAGDNDMQAIGLAVAIIGGLAAQVVLLIGIIAKGVEIGNRASK